MKQIIRSVIIYSILFAFFVSVYPGLKISDGIYGIMLSGALYTLIIKIVTPVVKALLLPFNLITFGTLKWIINIINIVILVYFLPQFNIVLFSFPGINYGGISIDEFQVPKFISILIISLSLKPLKKLFINILAKSN